MEQQRLILFIALSLVLFLIWGAWQREFSPQPQPVTPVTQSSGKTTSSAPVPASGNDVPVAQPASAAPGSASFEPLGETRLVKQGQRIKVETDVFRIEIDTIGGDLRVVDLKKYPVSVDKPDHPFRLMKDGPEHLFIAQSGFTLRKKDDRVLSAAPNHTTNYRMVQSSYRLADGENKLTAVLSWTSPEGVVFIKSYTFTRGSYLIEVANTIKNPTMKDWVGNLYQQLQRTPIPKSEQPRFIHTYTGGVEYSPEDKYDKITFSDMQEGKLNKKVTGGWTAMIQHYFLAAWIPPADTAETFYSRYKPNPDRYTLGMKSDSAYRVKAGAENRFSNRLFVGPKLPETLAKIAPGLDLTVDYGVLTILANPIYHVLKFIHNNIISNWGWAIIILTLMIKLAFYKLSEKSYKSMAQMRKLTPRIKQLKERYGDDKQKMGQAQMELFRKEKINPLGGCLPILVQMPVFISLYWVLLESVELRQAPWILWIKDMSTADPYYVLPLLMGISMFIQQRLNPAPMDPIQAKLMMVLPFVFTVFFAFFPAGLVIYWVVNNTLSILQQWYITRVVIKS
ncbi:MAG TPA: membrane protein insertase YidC [Gammaproteobacteria bacterium]|nr:membrane protein insertase YidC [Gammaproteobacteria bacterium]